MYGYRIEKESIEINEGEAKIIRMIFKDYTDGIGCTLIAKKLRKMNIPKVRGGTWNSERVVEIIKNEKYTSNALFQKKYVKDHLNKTLVINKCNLPMYYAEGTHPAIIDTETFQRAQEIMCINAKKYSSKFTRVKYPFTSKIICNTCGKKYKHKSRKGRATWGCSTYLKYGKDKCPSKEIPEEILTSLTTDILGLKEFDEAVFEEKIKEIQVTQHKILVFVLRDGNKIIKKWSHKSRSEGWNNEARQKAKERSLKKLEKRG